jgi:hypothetical protein
LNARDYLAAARREAYGSYRARLAEYIRHRDLGARRIVLRRMVEAVRKMQHPTVWWEMRRQQKRIPELTELFQLAPEALSW